jgi:hypothetical protein
MGLREDLLRRIERKQQELEDLRRHLEIQIREGQAYIQGLQDTLKMLPRDAAAQPPPTLRPGTDLAKARDAIRKAGAPMHISDLLKALGKAVNPTNRAGLSGNLAAYVRRGEIFTRTGPNIFGLVELEQRPQGPPEGFGKVGEAEEEFKEPDDDVRF